MIVLKGLKNLKRAWAGKTACLLAITFSVALLPLSANAIDQNEKQLQRMTYEMYGSGFHAVDATFDIDFTTPGNYRMELSAHTRGFLASVAPWEGNFETHGWYDSGKDMAQPEIHKSSTVWDEELEVKEYNYKKDGSFGEYRVTDEHSDRELRKVGPDLTQGTTDVFTAALEMMQDVAAGGACEGTSQEIFDGKRRYRMVFRAKEDVVLQQSRYNVYEGPAKRCEVEVEQIAGNWHKKPRGWMSIQEQGRENGKLPTIWMANIHPEGPAVPVKIFVKTAYGSLFLHLVKYENGYTQLAFKDD